MSQHATTPATSGVARSELELNIGGMTCASCAARIEKKLNKLDGVVASVNYATEKAKVSYPDNVTPEDVIGVVAATGYTAALPAPPSREDTDGTVEDGGRRARDEEAAAWWQRLVVSALLSAPVLLLSMVPVLQFDNCEKIVNYLYQ